MSNKFKLVSTKTIRVGEQYDHAHQIAKYVAGVYAQSRINAKIHPDFNDKTFAKTTPAPFGKLTIRAYELTGDVTLEECEAFAQECHSLPLGAQGLTLALKSKAVGIPYSKRVDENGGVLVVFAFGHKDESIPCVGSKWPGQRRIGFINRNESCADETVGREGNVLVLFSSDSQNKN